MKIKKATELLKELGKGVSLPDMQEYQDACNLGIEALKRVDKARHYKHDLTQVLLPGETE